MVEKKYTIVRRECDITLTLSEGAFLRVMGVLGVMGALGEDDRITGSSEEYQLFYAALQELKCDR